MADNKKFSFSSYRWSVLFSIIVSTAILAYFFRTINFKDFWSMFVSASPFGIWLYFIFATINVWLRAFRYRVLIGHPGIKMADLIPVTLVRNCTVDLLPHRAGELAYVFLLSRKYSLPLKSSASSLILAVIFDYIAVVPIIFLSLFFVEFKNSVYFFGILGGLTLMAVSIFFLPFILALANRHLTGFFKGQSKTKISRFLEETGQEISLARQKKIYLPVFFLSLVIRIVKYLSLFFLAAAFFGAYGIHWYDLSFSHVVLGTVGAELTSFLPVKGLAGLGTWEAAWAVVMKMLGYPAAWGIATGLGVHLTTQIFEYLLGGIALVYIYWRKSPAGTEEEKK